MVFLLPKRQQCIRHALRCKPSNLPWPANGDLQTPRVAKARGLKVEEVRANRAIHRQPKLGFPGKCRRQRPASEPCARRNEIESVENERPASPGMAKPDENGINGAGTDGVVRRHYRSARRRRRRMARDLRGDVLH